MFFVFITIPIIVVSNDDNNTRLIIVTASGIRLGIILKFEKEIIHKRLFEKKKKKENRCRKFIFMRMKHKTHAQ